MQSKLTLSIDKDVIVRAKHYAQENQQSVSSLVEAYLDRLSMAQKKTLHKHTMRQSPPV